VDRELVYNDQLTAPQWALNSAVECHPHTVEVIGSNPIAPTTNQLILLTLPRRPCPQMSSWLISARFFLREDHSYDAGMGRAFLFADRLSVNIYRGSHVGVPHSCCTFMSTPSCRSREL
jgi:hypothetical protein